MVWVTPLRSTPCNLPNLNAVVAISMGMWAVKLCWSKILQFLEFYDAQNFQLKIIIMI